MALTLYYHPLSSYCHKVLIALYEANTAFVGQIIDLGNESHRAMLQAHWPLGKFPVLHDSERNLSLPESSIIVEYLDRFAGAKPLIPVDQDSALQARLWDRILDNYLQTPMQEIVVDRLRQTNADMTGARALLSASYQLINQQLANRKWIAHDTFSLADCAAAPALFYAHTLVPIPDENELLRAYFDRLMDRPSVRRVIAEARPFFHLYPFADAIPDRFKTTM
jgi:glutathione S-transferase